MKALITTETNKTAPFNCDIHGETTTYEYFRDNQWRNLGCSVCKNEQVAKREKDERLAEERRLEQEKQDRIRKLFRNSLIPKRYSQKNFEDFVATNPQSEAIKQKCSDYAEQFLTKKENGSSLILCGSTGTGKTHLSCAIANHIIQNYQQTVVFVNVIDAISQIKQTWGKGNEKTEQQAILDYCAPDLLILDEVGVQFGTETEQMLLFRIINRRYEQVLPTIIISNLTPLDLKAALTDRIVDRMREGGGGMMQFNWDSNRGKNPQPIHT